MDNLDFSKIYSPSKLDLFIKCPKAYHFSYLDPIYSKMKAKLRRDPEYIWPFQTLGKSVHDALTLFLHLDKANQTIQNLKDQLKISWRSEAMYFKRPPLGKWGGFKDLTQEREYYREALEMLQNFHKTYNFDSKIHFIPTKDLNHSIDDYKKLVKPISDVYDISGKFDLILKLSDESLEVVDFKTGKDERSNNFQLKFYKLLAELNFTNRVIKASFYYLRSGNRREFDLTKEDSKETKKIILEKIDQIKKTPEFKPKPSKLCRYCLFKNFCPAKKEIEAEIGREKKDDFIDDLPF